MLASIQGKLTRRCCCRRRLGFLRRGRLLQAQQAQWVRQGTSGWSGWTAAAGWAGGGSEQRQAVMLHYSLDIQKGR